MPRFSKDSGGIGKTKPDILRGGTFAHPLVVRGLIGFRVVLKGALVASTMNPAR